MRPLFASGLSFGLALATSLPARGAEQAIIGHPDDHPIYRFDAEPHAIVGFGGPVRDDGTVGVGFRGTFIILEEGFLKKVNDNVGIGVGIDAFVGSSGVADVPVVMQWNFFMSTHWSLFGEPGVGFGFGSSGNFHPVLAAGGRYHFTEKIALTLRLGYPAISAGVSFLF